MSFADWQERYDLGIAEIDREHRILFDLIGQFHDAHAAGHGVDRLDHIFQVLHQYVANHFDHEQSLFAGSRYPHAKRHVKEHERFARDLEQLYRRYHQAGDPKVCIDLLGMLTNWWLFHVLEDDAEFGRHLRNGEQRQ